MPNLIGVRWVSVTCSPAIPFNSFQNRVLDPRTIQANKTSHSQKLEKVMSATGLSHNAKRFLSKALHPASDIDSPGIPDQNEVDLYRTELRSTHSHSSGGITTNWDCMIWCPPGDNTVAIVATGLAGVDFRTATLAAGTPANSKEVYVERYTFADNVPGGLFAGNLVGHSVLRDATQVLYPPHERFFATTYGRLMPKRWRTTASSLTVNLIANATQNQGSVYCWEGGRSYVDGVAFESIDTVPIMSTAAFQPGTSYIQGTGTTPFILAMHTGATGPAVSPFNSGGVHEALQTKSTSVPFDETDMFMQSPHLYATNAYNGVYCVHRFMGPDQPLQNSSDAPHNVLTPVNGYKVGSLEWNGDVNWALSRYTAEIAEDVGQAWSTPQMNVVPLNIVARDIDIQGVDWTTGLSVPPWLRDYVRILGSPDTSFDNVTTSVTIFRSIDPDATLQIKRLLSLEAAPLESSPSKPFVTPPIDFEPQALRMYYEISHRLEAVHPANYNDFSTIVNKIANVINKYAGVAAGVASLVAPEFAPEIGMIGGGVKAAAGVVANMTKKQKAVAREVLSVPKPVRPRLVIKPRPKPKPKLKAKRRF